MYANPEKELVRPRRNGLVIRIAHGTYIAKPDTGAPSEPWKPPFEEAAMAYATASHRSPLQSPRRQGAEVGGREAKDA